MKKPKKYAAALYMRLSKDDDHGGESASIGTQRKILLTYANEHGFEVYDEYVDDGYSGTNFDRPAWKRLLSDIEQSRINLVIAKDLSRLGRDYIMTGQYTELFFPSKGVRCIAINDAYDSDNPFSDMAPFKNVINEMYARDISKKIRSAFQVKMAEGAFIGNFAPYGYQKDPQNKNHLLVDPNVAPLVKEMFYMAESGTSPAEIAKTFNKRGIMTPAMYRCAQHPHLNGENDTSRKEWTSSMVCKMLSNVVYMGHVAQGKTTKVSFKTNAIIQNSRDEWITVTHMHEPLVSEETFEKVRSRSIARGKRNRTGFTNIFSGIAKCSDCSRNLSTSGGQKKSGSYNLVCGGYKLYGKKECSNHLIDYQLLYKIMQQEIRQLLHLTDLEKEELLKDLFTASESAFLIEEDAPLKRRVNELEQIIRQLYEDKVAERINESRFCKMLKDYEAEQKRITEHLASLEKAKGLSDTDNKQNISNSLSAILDDLLSATKLTPESLHTLVEKIEVSQGWYENGKRSSQKHQTIRIYYSFIDPEICKVHN